MCVQLINSWIDVYENVIGKVDTQYISQSVIPHIESIPGLKNPLPKRKRGNRLVFAMCKNIGEENLDKDPKFVKLMLSICHDNNYKIRRDGVLFLREYIMEKKEEILKSARFQDVYLPELIDFLNDEDSYIKMDAIETVTQVLKELSEDQIKNDYIEIVKELFDIDNNVQEIN